MTLYYQAENVTLHHGDCLEIDGWLEADVLVTDPPYGINHRDKRMSGSTLSDRTRRSQERIAQGITYPIGGDRDPGLRDAALTLWGSDKPGLVFGHWRIPRPGNTRQRLLWCKTDPGTGLCGGETHPWITKDEEIYVIGRSMSQFADTKTDSNLYITRESRSIHVQRVGHPTPKPTSLMDRLIGKCPPGTIADPFAGSGSTLVAARNLGRKAIGVEIEERYCEIIANRLDQLCLNFEEPA